MIGFVTTKSKISTFLLTVLLMVILICTVVFKVSGSVASGGESGYPAGEKIERIAFIENLGYIVNKAVEEQSKQVEIPYIFSDTYEGYQQIQLKAGYDLKKYMGSKVTLYTYNLMYENRNDVYANLLVLDNAVIGGDISALSVTDGFINPLVDTY